jgi:hypothetical protein
MDAMRSLAWFALGILAVAGCAASTGKPQGWSEAGRRANARHAWHCSGQGTDTAPRERTFVRGPVTRHQRDPGCDRERFLCEQIHRGAQATAGERAECSAYEAAHGRVSGR